MSGGHTTDPTYNSVGTGKTGHVEVVRVIYFNQNDNLNQCLKVFWEHHDPTQTDGQANDIGPNYKSTVFCSDKEQMATVLKSRDAYQNVINIQGQGKKKGKWRQMESEWRKILEKSQLTFPATEKVQNQCMPALYQIVNYLISVKTLI